MRLIGRWIGMVAIATVSLELFFLGRIALMTAIDPQSTTFQRSQAWRLAVHRGDGIAGSGSGSGPLKSRPAAAFHWSQEWVPYAQVSENLKRAVIASEDGGFVNHEGVDWEALEKAWQKNEIAAERVAKRGELKNGTTPAPAVPTQQVKIVGGSTITQQLAKNLLLSGERTLLRKGQEFVLAMMLEALLSKQRILEIYLNSVEWGNGIFGAEAAAQRYNQKSAARLSMYEAARLAVMLPRPRYFEQLPNSGYLSHRASIITARMKDVEVP